MSKKKGIVDHQEKFMKDVMTFHKGEEAKQSGLLSSVGFFLLRFERCMELMRSIITEILKKNGLEESRYADILLFDATAKNILDYYRAIMFEHCHKRPDWKMILEFNDLIKNRMMNASRIRNTIMHADFNISTYKSTRLFGVRYGLDEKTGELQNTFKFSSDKILFENWNNELVKLTSVLVQLEFNLQHEEDKNMIEGINLVIVKSIKLEWPKVGEENHRGKKPVRKVAARIISK